MRLLAHRLGYEVMSLYNHVVSKADLLAGMVDTVVTGVDLPSSDEPWPRALRRSCLSAHEALNRHPWVSELWTTSAVGPARMDLMEAWLEALRRSDLSPHSAHRGFHALSNHVVGFALQQGAITGAGQTGAALEDRKTGARSFLETIDPQVHPRMVEHVEQHLHEAELDSSFGYVLDLILDGLAADRDAPESASS